MIKYLAIIVVTVGLCAQSSFSIAQSTADRMYGNAEAQALVKQGNALWAEKKVAEAFEKFRLANIADPKASAPLSTVASLYFMLSTTVPAERVSDFRQRSKQFSEQALQLNPEDPVAQEVLRRLSAPNHIETLSKNADAMRSYNEAEQLFQRGEFRQAIQSYQKAVELDPQFAKAELYTGDAYFQLGDYVNAEKFYTRSLALDTRQFQAWRFLAHAQMKLERPIALIKESLIHSIEALPNYLPAWQWYVMAREKEGAVFRQADVRRPLSFREHEMNGRKQFEVLLDKRIQENIQNNDGELWVRYGAFKAAAMGVNTSVPAATKLSPLQMEIEAWQTVFKNIDSRKKLTDPLLLVLQRAVAEDELEVMIYLFLFDEAYRSEFEQWKKTHPASLQAYIDKAALSPRLSPN